MRTINLIYPNLSGKRVGAKLAIRDEFQLRHLKVVRADSRSYQFTATDGKGLSAELEIVKLTKEGALFKVTSKQNLAQIEGAKLSVAIPLIKPQNLEVALAGIAQFNVVEDIYLYFSEFNRFSQPKDIARKLPRLEKIVQSAVTQSRSQIIPQIKGFAGLAELLASAESDASFAKEKLQLIYPHLESETLTWEELASFSNGKSKRNLLIVGPEGGFSPAELDLLINNTSEKLSFKYGDSVLRTETAVLAFTTLLKLSSS